MNVGSLRNVAGISIFHDRLPMPTSNSFLPENRPKCTVPVAFAEFGILASDSIQCSVIKLAMSKPTTMQFIKNVANTNPRVFMLIFIYVTQYDDRPQLIVNSNKNTHTQAQAHS